METDRLLIGTQVFINVDGSCLRTVPVGDSKGSLKVQQLPEEGLKELHVIVSVNKDDLQTYNICPDNHNLEVDEPFYVRPNSDVIIYGINGEYLEEIPSPQASNKRKKRDWFGC